MAIRALSRGGEPARRVRAGHGSGAVSQMVGRQCLGPLGDGLRGMGGSALASRRSWPGGRIGSTSLSSAPTGHFITSGRWHGWGPSVTDYERLGGVCMSAPRAVAWGPNRLDVFVIGTDSALYHKWWDGATWGPSVTASNTWAASASVSPRSWPGVRTGSMSSSSAPTAPVPQMVGRRELGAVGDRLRIHGWRVHVATESRRPGARTGSMCSSPEPTAPCTTNGGTAADWGPSVTGYEYMGGIISSFREGATSRAEGRAPKEVSDALRAAAQLRGNVATFV